MLCYVMVYVVLRCAVLCCVGGTEFWFGLVCFIVMRIAFVVVLCCCCLLWCGVLFVCGVV